MRLTRSEARPGAVKTKQNLETGEMEFKGYGKYRPTDRGKGEKWFVAEDVHNQNQRLFEKESKLSHLKKPSSTTTLKNYLKPPPGRGR